jgi:pyruvate-formate lyase-activating enzyme
VETEPGSGVCEEVPNPIGAASAVGAVCRLFAGRAGLVSITGGEPLLQPEGVRALAAALRARGMQTLLETHGLHAKALAEVVAEIDVVSMDWKLASSVRRASDPRHGAVAPFHDAHDAFLRCAAGAADSGTEAYVKVVLTSSTEQAELDEVCDRIARVAPKTPLVLQPVTPHGPVRDAPEPHQVLAWARACAQRLDDVRVIPQTHKMVGVA